MADKDFKVKTGLDLPAPLPLSEGGTGQTSAENTRNALMPVQTGHSGKFITTDGTGMSWAVAPQQTATDGAAGYKVYAGNTTPTGQNVGDIWIDATTGNGIQLVRWRKTIAAGTSTISGLDDNNLTLTYTAGNEQVYINGTLITRGQDYTATNGTSISLTQAVEVGDTVEIFGNPLFSVTDTYTQAQANNLYVAKSGFDSGGKNILINGGFDIWQRGTTINAISGYCVDRWNAGAGATTNLTRQSSGAPLGSQYYARLTYAASNAFCNFHQYIETAECSRLWGKTVTASAKIRRSASMAGGMDIAIWKSSTVDAGSGASWSIVAYTRVNNLDVTTGSGTSDWSTISVTTAIPSDGSANSIRFTIAETAVSPSGAYYEIAQAQLEIGSVITPFSRAGGTIAGELVACQRYYWRQDAFQMSGGTSSSASNIIWFSLTSFNTVPMRAQPTAAIESSPYITNFSGNLRTITGISVASKYIVGFAYDSTILAANGSFGINFADTGRALSFSAEI